MKNTRITLQKIGGIAALGHTAAPGVDMVLSFTVMIPLLNAPPERGLNFLTDSKTIIFRYGLYYVFLQQWKLLAYC
jgi:hypothetical protein